MTGTPNQSGGGGAVVEAKADIVERLRTVECSRDPARGFAGGPTTNWYRNPDGPEAASIIEALVAALEPIADELRRRDSQRPGPDIDHWPIGGNYLTYGDLRRACIALAKARGEA